jgi:DNA polymerase-3 subunit epsilon
MSAIPVVIDLETTGIDLETDSIVQIAAVMVDLENQRAVTLMSNYCNPGRPIDAEATEVHGIKDVDVVWAVPAAWALIHLKMILDSLEAAGNDIVICGQNHERFDIPIMRRILPSAGFETYLSVDTYTIALREHPAMPHQLGEFFSWYCEKEAINAHDAAADCHMVAAILMKYLNERGISIIDLATELEEPKVLTHFPFGKHKGMAMDKLPHSYLKWCRGNFHDTHKDVEATICDALGCDEWIVHP